MKTKFFLAVVMWATAAVLGYSKASGGSVHVGGYTKANGTYVAPYTRSAPNGTKADNWSTKGNVNPVTGAPGTKNVTPAAAPATAASAQPSTSQTNAPAPQPAPTGPSAIIITGMTDAKLREIKGTPSGSMTVGNVTVYSWPDMQVGLVDGKVQKIMPR